LADVGRPSTKLEDRQVQAVLMDLDGKAALEICNELSIGTKTLANWRKLPEYKTMLVEMCRAKFAGLVPKALKMFEEVLADKTAPAMARVRAGELVLKGAALVVGELPGGAQPEQGDQAQHGVVMMPPKRVVQQPDATHTQTLVVTGRPVSMDTD